MTNNFIVKSDAGAAACVPVFHPAPSSAGLGMGGYGTGEGGGGGAISPASSSHNNPDIGAPLQHGSSKRMPQPDEESVRVTVTCPLLTTTPNVSPAAE